MDRQINGRKDGWMKVYMDAFSTAYELFLPFLVTKVIEDPV